MLSIRNLDVNYDKTMAVKNISLNVDYGQVVGLIGSNGSGKSTILRSISGFVIPMAGEIIYKNKSILEKKPHEIVKAGVIHVTQERDLFPELTVLENLRLGSILQKDKKTANQCLEDIFKNFPILKERERQKAGTLSGGEQRILAINRAMMANPKLLLLDEPTSGVAPIFVKRIVDLLKLLIKKGITMLIVEHNASVVFSLSNYYYALRNGSIVAEGRTDSLPANKDKLIFKILYDRVANSK
jgi:branched-chain amino acid transport system ATP-binding protein